MIYWFYVQTKTVGIKEQNNQPQEYMLNLHTTNYNVDGKPTESLQAEYWEFNPSIGCSSLTKPSVVVYKSTDEIWHLSSNKALAWHQTLHDKISKINMQEDVIIERPAHNEVTPVKVETNSLNYIPQEEKITSNDFVRMQQPGLVISGYGLLGYLDRNWIELHEKITTIYTP